MNPEEKQRLGWVKVYEQTQNAGLTCRRCGISRPTLRKWWGRYQSYGQNGLQSKSRRPYTSPMTKVDETIEALILSMRKEWKLGGQAAYQRIKTAA